MGRSKNIYKPLRNRHGEGKRRYTTIGLNDEVAAELKLVVKAYSEIYGKMTPAQVIKRLIDAGLKRCDPEVFDAFIRLTEEGPEPVLEIDHYVDPTEGNVWEMKYFFEKDGEQIPAEWAKSEKASFSAKINNRYYGVREMLKNGWTLWNDAGIKVTEEQAMIIAQKRRKYLEELEFQALASYTSTEEEDFLDEPEYKVKIEKDGVQKEVWSWELDEYYEDGWSLQMTSIGSKEEK